MTVKKFNRNDPSDNCTTILYPNYLTLGCISQAPNYTLNTAAVVRVIAILCNLRAHPGRVELGEGLHTPHVA